MTPLVREMATLVPEPETAHWFDLGTIHGRIKHCRVGNPADGVVFKDYRIRSEK